MNECRVACLYSQCISLVLKRWFLFVCETVGLRRAVRKGNGYRRMPLPDSSLAYSGTAAVSGGRAIAVSLTVAIVCRRSTDYAVYFYVTPGS